MTNKSVTGSDELDPKKEKEKVPLSGTKDCGSGTCDKDKPKPKPKPKPKHSDNKK